MKEPTASSPTTKPTKSIPTTTPSQAASIGAQPPPTRMRGAMAKVLPIRKLGKATGVATPQPFDLAREALLYNRPLAEAIIQIQQRLQTTGSKVTTSEVTKLNRRCHNLEAGLAELHAKGLPIYPAALVCFLELKHHALLRLLLEHEMFGILCRWRPVT